MSSSVCLWTAVFWARCVVDTKKLRNQLVKLTIKNLLEYCYRGRKCTQKLDIFSTVDLVDQPNIARCPEQQLSKLDSGQRQIGSRL